MTPHRAVAALVHAARDYPDCWRQLDQLLHDVRSSGVTWEPWCWAPLAAAYALVSEGRRIDPLKAGDVARIGALAAWRVTQGIYRIDETLLDELWASEVDGALPSSTLQHLPEWCVYVETPGRVVLGQRLHGFWAHLEHDSNDGRVELRLLLDRDAGQIGFPLHLGHGRGTLADAGMGALRESAAQSALLGDSLGAQQLLAIDPTRLAAEFRPLVSLVLYLATTSETLRSSDGRAPSRPPPRAGRRGEAPRYYPPAQPALYEPGLRLGAQLRAARERARTRGDGSGSRPVGHVRRAHWHTYLLGPRDSEQRREVRWLPPIFVLLDPEQAAPVVHPVR